MTDRHLLTCLSNSIDNLAKRVEALETQYETQRLATLEWGKALDRHDRWIDDHLKRIMALEAEQAPHILTVPELPSSPPSSLPSRLHELTPTTLQPPLSEPAQSPLQSPCDGQTAVQPLVLAHAVAF